MKFKLTDDQLKSVEESAVAFYDLLPKGFAGDMCIIIQDLREAREALRLVIERYRHNPKAVEPEEIFVARKALGVE